MSETVELLKSLVAINSVNPDLVPGAAGETAAADFCARWLGERGFAVERLEARPGRPSVIGRARGSGGGRTLLFNGHLDTVGVAGYHGNPFEPRIAEGRLYGRGAVDMKAGVAAMMVAASRAAAARLRGDVIVACVADEEYGSLGSEEVAKHVRADACIVTEPTDLTVTVAHKGFVWFDIEVEGRAAHGSRPDLGIDAIVKAGKVLVALESHARELARRPAHPLLGCGSVHASFIEGGQEMSSYPARCRIRLERRTVPGERLDGVELELAAMLASIASADPDFRATYARGFSRSPLEVPATAEIVRVLQQAGARRLGAPPSLGGMTGWTDAQLFDAAGIPSVLFGPSGAGLHAAEEWVDIASVEAVADVLEAVAEAFCG